jgi:ADP-ribosylglycohydrolase
MELIAGNPAEPRTGGTESGMPDRAGRGGAPRGGLADRARGSLLGLAVGDALGAPAENLRPSEIRRRWGRIEGFVSDDPAGTDDTEYAIFSGLLLARHGSALTVTHVERAWHLWIADLDEGPFRGAGFSERGTLENLRRGLAAPISAQHRHAWSDGLAMRAAPFGVFAAGRPDEAARLVAVDGRVSHDGEGIYGGQAVAAGVAAAMTGAGVTSVIAAALSVVPMDSWTARSLRRAVAAAQRGYPDRLTMERAVRSAVVVGGYPWTDLAPEAVGLAFGAFTAARGDFRTAVLTAVNMGRDADTTAAVAGALAGALNGASAIPRHWGDAIGPVRGSCLPTMRGHHVLEIAELLTPDVTDETDEADEAEGTDRADRADGTDPAHESDGACDARTDDEGPARTRPRTGAAEPRNDEPRSDEPRSEPRTTADAAPPPHDAPRAPATPASPATRLRTRPAVGRRARIEGLLLGLASGDAAGWPAARHRAARMPEWTRRLTRELDTFAEQNATTTLPVPIALNQPPEPLRLGPSDDAEWAAFAAGTVLTSAAGPLHGLSPGRRLRAAIDVAWNALAAEVAAAAARAPEVESAVLPLRARISVRAGLGNLAAGLRPPATGHDNPHYFDDAACVRAAVLAVAHPADPAAAADLAEFDARYTQDGDGVHGARAMAAAIAEALGGADVDTAVNAALAQLPEGTEIARNAAHAVRIARDFVGEAAGAFALVPVLEHQIVDHVYSYGIAAAETVPVTLALATAARGQIAQAVPAAACLSRVADSAPALAGALTGALGGIGAVPDGWREACRTLAGCALPRLAGTDLIELAGLLADTEPKPPGGQFGHDIHDAHAVRGRTHDTHTR